MGKDVKMKHSASSSLPKNWWKKKAFLVFSQKSFAWGDKVFGQIYGAMLYMATGDQIMQGGS